MSDQQRCEFLMHGTRTGKLSVVRADGSPHVAPIWFVLDGDDVIFTTGADTVKGKSLRRDGRVALCVDDDNPPFSYVIIRGVATVSEDLDEMLRWATQLGARYMGAGVAEQFGRRNAVPGELLVRVTPTAFITEYGVAD
jgi:hypothetical protein